LKELLDKKDSQNNELHKKLRNLRIFDKKLQNEVERLYTEKG